MGYQENQEEYTSFKKVEELNSKNIPREYSRWAFNFLTNKGINPNTVNLTEYYDRSKSLEENRDILVSAFSESPRAEAPIQKKYPKRPKEKESALGRLSKKAGELKYRFIDAPRERRLKERRFKVMSKKEEIAIMREEMAIKRQERAYAREMGHDAPRTSPLKSLTGPSKQILFGGGGESELLKRFESGGGSSILSRFATGGGSQGKKAKGHYVTVIDRGQVQRVYKPAEQPQGSNLLEQFAMGGQGASQSQNNSILKRLATSNKPKLDFSFKPGKRKLPKWI